MISAFVFIHSFFASLCLLYVYGAWADRRRVVFTGLLTPRPAIEHRTSFFLTAVHSGKDDDMMGTGGLRKTANGGKPGKDRWSMASDWVAPVIVWFLVITMSLAIVGFLLGER